MAGRERTTAAIEEALNAAQVEFSLNPLFMAPQAKHFFEAQERLREESEKFWSAWFQRRQDAAQSLIDAGKRIASEGQTDPASAMMEILDWQMHSMERLAEDGKDCAEMLSRCAGAFVESETEAMKDVSETMKRATKSSKSEPV